MALEKTRAARRRPVLALLAVTLGFALLATGLGLVLGTPGGHSLKFNLAWHEAFSALFWQGQPYPRYLPDLWYGLGGLDLFFYGPLPFWLSALLAPLCAGCTASTQLAMAGAVLWTASIPAFWVFARGFLAPLPALSGALVYAMLPYHLAIDWVVRQAIGEFAAFVFVPLVFAGLHAIMQARPGRGLFAAGLAGLIYSHLPSFLLVAHAVILIAVLWAVLPPKPLARILPAALDCLWLGAAGVLLAAPYWVPTIWLMGDVSTAALYTEALSPAAWLWFDGRAAPDPGLSLILGICLGGTLGAVAMAGVFARGAHDWLIWIVAPVLASAALMTGPALPLWENWVIGKVQFPWRLMLLTDLAGALAAGMLATQVLSTAPRWHRGLALVGIAALFVGLAASGPRLMTTLTRGLAAQDAPVEMLGAPEYLPPAIFAQVAADLGARDLAIWQAPIVIEEIARAAVPLGIDAVTAMPRGHAITLDGGAEVILPIPYWHRFRAEDASGTQLQLSAAEPYGMTAIAVPDPAPGQTITLTLPRLAAEWVGLALGLAGLAGLVMFLVSQRRAQPRPTPPFQEAPR